MTPANLATTDTGGELSRIGSLAPPMRNFTRSKHGHDRLCWLSRGSQSPPLWECVSPEAWPRSLWPSNVVCKTAVPRVFDLTNRVCRDEDCAPYPGYLPARQFDRELFGRSARGRTGPWADAHRLRSATAAISQG